MGHSTKAWPLFTTTLNCTLTPIIFISPAKQTMFFKEMKYELEISLCNALARKSFTNMHMCCMTFWVYLCSQWDKKGHRRFAILQKLNSRHNYQQVKGKNHNFVRTLRNVLLQESSKVSTRGRMVRRSNHCAVLTKRRLCGSKKIKSHSN